MNRKFARRFAQFAVAPLLAFLTLLSWSFASPVGASPDDDFHLASIWCAGSTSATNCSADGQAPGFREVPRALLAAPCYVADENASAACQEETLSWTDGTTAVTQRGNFARGGYPPVYYAVAGLLTGPDIQASVLAIRVLNVALFVSFSVALYWLLPHRIRLPLVAGWLISTVPLGLFIIASNNPGSWALTGVVSSALALFGWFETRGRQKIGLGIVFVLAVLVAAGSRGDAAAYAGLGMALVVVLCMRRDRLFWRDTILPAVMVIIAFLFFLSSRQVNSGVRGFSGGSENAQEQLGQFGLLAYNILNVPWLWSGIFGDWGLGWTYTSMPRIVPFAAMAAFVVVGAAGISMMSRRKAWVLGAMVVILWALPVYVLQMGGDSVGANVTPRYILPLVALFAALLLIRVPGRAFVLTRPLRFAVGAALAGAHFVALHISIRRYVTGLDVGGLNLAEGQEWWWAGPIGPNAVWLLGSLAFALLVWILLSRTIVQGSSTATQESGTPITR